MARKPVAAMVVTLSAVIWVQGWAVGLLHFNVTQVRQIELGTPAVRAYLDLQDLDDQPVQTLPEASLSATLGSWGTEVIQVAPFASLNRGVAYVFLVDISKSLSTELFDQMVDGIEAWVEDMAPADRAAIIAFGETSRLLTDFTDDRDALLAALASLGPTDSKTLFFQALADGLDLCGRLDPGLPGRRALVVFSDGKDEGSSFVAEDVLSRIREDPKPIYAIGYSRLRDPIEREAYLQLLQRIATNSGGAFYGTEQTHFAETYSTIRRKIGEVWVADFSCPECQPDGSLQRLQVTVSLDGQVLSSGGSVRLLPVMQTAAELEPAAKEPETAPDSKTTAPATNLDATENQADRSRRVPWVWLIAIALLVTAILVWRKLASTRPANGTASEQPSQTQAPDPAPTPIDPRSEGVLDPPVPPPMPGTEPSFTRPPAPIRTLESRAKVPPIRARLVVVRGSRRGKQYSFIVDDAAVVGKRSSCTCVLTDEAGIDAEQFELTHEDGGLFIRNLSTNLPTLISGGPINGKLRLTSDTLIGTGETVLRIVFF